MGWQMPRPPERPVAGTPGRTCANCKIEIEHDAVEKGGVAFCCDGCAYGGPCVC